MGGRRKSNSVEEITLQVPSLDPRFSIFIDLCTYTNNTQTKFRKNKRRLYEHQTDELTNEETNKSTKTRTHQQ